MTKKRTASKRKGVTQRRREDGIKDSPKLKQKQMVGCTVAVGRLWEEGATFGCFRVRGGWVCYDWGAISRHDSGIQIGGGDYSAKFSRVYEMYLLYCT